MPIKIFGRNTSIIIGRNQGRVINGDLVINGDNAVIVNSGEVIQGSGVAKTKTRPSQPFSRIEIVGPINVSVVTSETPLIQVTADDNLVDLIMLEYSGDTLEVGIKPNTSFSTSTPLKVQIHAISIEAGEITGSGDLTIAGLNQTNFEVAVTGSGTINLHGAVVSLSAKITGSGDVDATKLKAETAKLKVSGSGDIRAHVTSDCHARVSGSGDIVIFGNPTNRNTKVSGSGDIDFR